MSKGIAFGCRGDMPYDIVLEFSSLARHVKHRDRNNFCIVFYTNERLFGKLFFEIIILASKEHSLHTSHLHSSQSIDSKVPLKTSDFQIDYYNAREIKYILLSS